MILDDAQFSPHWIPSLIGLVLVISFCSLGMWQLDRAEQKRQLATDLNERKQQSPLVLNEYNVDSLKAKDFEHRTLTATGTYLPHKTVFVENRKHRGKTGFYVITPLLVADTGGLLLVNRGWVQADTRLALPVIDTPGNVVMVTGMATVPAEPVLDLRPDQLDHNSDIQRWPFFTLERFKQWSREPAFPWLLLLSADSDSGFVRRWPKPRVDDSMHIGYALQWFAFAIIVLLIWTKLSFIKQANREAVG